MTTEAMEPDLRKVLHGLYDAVTYEKSLREQFIMTGRHAGKLASSKAWHAVERALREADAALATASAERAAPAGSPLGRDADWVLAMGHALGLDSGFSVPIVPSVDAFRDLFAAVRAQAPAVVQPVAPDLIARLRQAGADYTIEWGSGELYDEAADEIERLSTPQPAAHSEAPQGLTDEEIIAAIERGRVTWGRSVGGGGEDGFIAAEIRALLKRTPL